MQFNLEKEITIETDILDYTIGMRIIQQEINRKPQAVAFYS